MKYLLFSFALLSVTLSYSQSIIDIGLAWNITEEQQPKTDSIDIDQNGSTNILIHSYFYEYWNSIEVVLIDLDGNFNTNPHIRVVSNYNDQTIQDCGVSGINQTNISGYIYSDLPNITIHQNKTVRAPILIETESGMYCGFILVQYSGNIILIDKIIYNNNSSTECDCTLGFYYLDNEENKNSIKYNLMGQTSNGIGYYIENGKLNYGNQ